MPAENSSVMRDMIVRYGPDGDRRQPRAASVDVNRPGGFACGQSAVLMAKLIRIANIDRKTKMDDGGDARLPRMVIVPTP